MNSASLSGLACRYDNPIPTWFLTPIDFLKIPALDDRVEEGQALGDAEQNERETEEFLPG